MPDILTSIHGRKIGLGSTGDIITGAGGSVVINNDTTVTVIEIRGDKVRLGTQAPEGVPIHRKEIQERIERERAA